MFRWRPTFCLKPCTWTQKQEGKRLRCRIFLDQTSASSDWVYEVHKRKQKAFILCLSNSGFVHILIWNQNRRLSFMWQHCLYINVHVHNIDFCIVVLKDLNFNLRPQLVFKMIPKANNKAALRTTFHRIQIRDFPLFSILRKE